MKSNDPPPAPDPEKVARAQTASNKETAIANANLNRVDQTNPFGTSTWQVTGTNPDGTPKYAQTTAFSQPVQGLFDSNMAMSKGLADTGVSQLQQLQQQYSTPFSLDTEAENRIVDLQRKRLDPAMAQREEALRTRLTNQGIREGTEAWDRALTREGQISNDAYNQMYINARGQGVNEAITQRQMPLQEFNSIRTGTSPQMPQFSGVPQTQQANTDVAGITQQGFQNQMAGWQQEQANNNAFMSGLFGLGSAGIKGFMASDRRLKRNVERIGSLRSGLPLYAFDYIWGGPRQMGVMAQEARELFPDAVVEIGGFLAVDYGRIG